MQNTNEEKKQFSTREMILLVFISLITGIIFGFVFKKDNNSNTIEDKYLNEFIKNYNYITNNYFEDVDKEKLVNGAISGMMESLGDPYSLYFDENESSNFSIALDGSYKGLGIQITKDENNGYMLVTAVFKESPAEVAGLTAGDYIISIDDKKSSDLSASDFSSYVRKNDKKEYILKILRNEEEKTLEIKKETVTLTSIDSNYYEEGNKKIGYIYIGIFANNTYSQFNKALKELENKKINYLIIDVRGNSGGHLTTVDGILDLFLNKNQKMYGMEKNGKKTYTYGTGTENKKYPIVLLGDESSASASEVLIAGLKDNLNSVFIGKKTYGKGTVQELITLSDGTQYKMTIKKWLTPKGICVSDTKGIVPDVEVDFSEGYYNTLDDKDDSQLQKAIEYIKEN